MAAEGKRSGRPAEWNTGSGFQADRGIATGIDDVWSTSASPPFFRNGNAGRQRDKQGERERQESTIPFHDVFMPPPTRQSFFPRVISMHNEPPGTNGEERAPLPNLWRIVRGRKRSPFEPTKTDVCDLFAVTSPQTSRALLHTDCTWPTLLRSSRRKPAFQ